MKKEEFIFCPLGGSGEIGMNMNLYAYGNPENRKWIIVDIGVTFADDTIPGVDLIYADPGFILDKKEDLIGLVLTHAHEDHIGAIAHIWPKLLCLNIASIMQGYSYQEYVLINSKYDENKVAYVVQEGEWLEKVFVKTIYDNSVELQEIDGDTTIILTLQP